jgi:hypothetical protein
MLLVDQNDEWLAQRAACPNTPSAKSLETHREQKASTTDNQKMIEVTPA